MGAFPLRVLLVENQPIMAAGVECVLKRLGHLVVGTAATGEAAIIAADKTRPDFVLMDVVLDGAMDGIEAAEEIRKHHGIRSVFLSDRSDQTTRVRAQAAGHRVH
jgi:DNA-binding NarL/FixJ family response regulator